MIGGTVSHHRIIEKLGGGGMGVVYRAEDTGLGRQVAIKVLLPELSRDPQSVDRFERIVTSGSRADDPLQFVRSLYFLGQIRERKGDRAKAAEYYRRFVQYWGGGDMDRDRVADARKKAG